MWVTDPQGAQPANEFVCERPPSARAVIEAQYPSAIVARVGLDRQLGELLVLQLGFAQVGFGSGDDGLVELAGGCTGRECFCVLSALVAQLDVALWRLAHRAALVAGDDSDRQQRTGDLGQAFCASRVRSLESLLHELRVGKRDLPRHCSHQFHGGVDSRFLARCEPLKEYGERSILVGGEPPVETGGFVA